PGHFGRVRAAQGRMTHRDRPDTRPQWLGYIRALSSRKEILMLTRQFTQCMLRPEALSASDERLHIVGTFNPGVTTMRAKTVLLVRVVEAVAEEREGFYSSPRLDERGQLDIDWFPEHEHDATDPRVYTHRTHGMIRLRFISHFRVFYSTNGRTLDNLNGHVLR